MDVVINNVDGPPVLLRNVNPDHRHWVAIALVGGPKSPRDAKNAAAPGVNVSSMSDHEAWPWTVGQWAVLVVLVLLAAAVVAVDTHILFRGGWPLWPL